MAFNRKSASSKRDLHKPSLLSYRKGRSLENVLVRSKLRRSKFSYLNQWESCLACQPFLSSNAAFEELVLWSLKASPLIKPFWLVEGGRRWSVYIRKFLPVWSACARREWIPSLIFCPDIRMYPGKLFLYLKFQPWFLRSNDGYLLTL